ncbi:MAG: MBL fold metallo-hydrolase [Phycisphaerales bacterium]|nr:MAG: MBL fold metallo-hydrolase [Phycisphaerales bacterium]
MQDIDGPRPAALCVLASGSSGNCSALRCPDGGVVLIDAGLSPRRTARALARVGHGLADVRAIVLTHLDHDHFYPAWTRALTDRLGGSVQLWVHARHAGWDGLEAVRQAGVLRTFEDAFQPGPTVAFACRLAEHDEHGVATFRVRTPQGELGYLTDLGRVTEALVDFHAGVDVLAIESNYCPRLQARSSRPAFLKRRIMGGAGHLSNPQCLEATEAIGPSLHAVFLHLSRECNSPEIVSRMHEGADYARTIARPDEPTRWVWVGGGVRPASASPRCDTLFGSHP